MLPFLKHNQESGSTALPDTIKREHDEDFDMLEACASDLISAIHSKDVKAVSEALKAAFEICESQPHQEGPHE